MQNVNTKMYVVTNVNLKLMKCQYSSYLLKHLNKEKLIISGWCRINCRFNIAEVLINLICLYYGMFVIITIIIISVYNLYDIYYLVSYAFAVYNFNVLSTSNELLLKYYQQKKYLIKCIKWECISFQISLGFSHKNNVSGLCIIICAQYNDVNKLKTLDINDKYIKYETNIYYNNCLLFDQISWCGKLFQNNTFYEIYNIFLTRNNDTVSGYEWLKIMSYIHHRYFDNVITFSIKFSIKQITDGVKLQIILQSCNIFHDKIMKIINTYPNISDFKKNMCQNTEYIRNQFNLTQFDCDKIIKIVNNLKS